MTDFTRLLDYLHDKGDDTIEDAKEHHPDIPVATLEKAFNQMSEQAKKYREEQKKKTEEKPASEKVQTMTYGYISRSTAYGYPKQTERALVRVSKGHSVYFATFDNGKIVSLKPLKPYAKRPVVEQ